MYRTLTGLVVCWALLAGLGSCVQRGRPGDSNSNCALPCTEDSECLAGHACAEGCCRAESDGSVDTLPPVPRILVDSTTLSYEWSPMGVPVTLPLTVTNGGDGVLEISEIEVEELDSTPEFQAAPQGPVSLTVPPGGAVVIQVTYTVLDAEVDLGRLRIHSNDPATPVLDVDLLLDCKCCDPVLDVCALDGALPAPEPFVDCQIDPVDGDPVVDFGVVSGTDATRVVAIRNLADGNAPLTLSDVTVTNDTGLGSVFHLALYRLEEDPQTGEPVEVTVTLPTFLTSGDPMAGVEPEVLFVRVVFSGPMDGLLPEESLVVVSNDLGSPLEIPIFGVSTWCPPGCWYTAGFCDCQCVFVQLEDSCAMPGVDLNCDGFIDTEDVDGCLIYYQDLDGDSYGTEDATRCLCGPDAATGHTSLVGGDCDDASPLAHPAATEVCDATDNDCDGVVDNGFDLQTDPQHCGACNQPCGATEQCVAGACVP